MLEKWRELKNKLQIPQGQKITFRNIVQSKAIMYFILFCAYFHNVLRFPQGSSLTLFRLLIPLTLCIIFLYSRKAFLVLVCASSGLVVLNLIQYVLSQKVFFPEINFSFGNMVLFWIHLISIFIFAGLIYCLRIAEKEKFVKNFYLFNGIIIKLSIICDAVFLLCGKTYKDFALFGNINDFGCAMVAGLAIILCGSERWWSKCIWSCSIITLLYVNDSKLALLGALLELAVFWVIKADAYITKRQITYQTNEKEACPKRKIYRRIKGAILKHWRLFAVSVCVAAMIGLLMSPIKINGYPIREMVGDAFSHLFAGLFYKNSNESLLFRVNAIIGMGTILKKSCLFGVGAGNTGVILRAILPSMEEMFENHIYVSPHVWWLELFADIGLICIIPAVALFIYHIKCLFMNQYKDSYSLLQTMILLSFPIWCMSSSGLYTEYYTLSLLIVAIMGTAQSLQHKRLNRTCIDVR